MADSQRKTAQIFNLSDASQMTSFNCTPTIYQGALTQVNRGIYARTEWSINKFQIGKRYTISVQFNNVDASSINVRILDSDGSTVIANSDTTTNTSGNLKVTFTARNVKQYIRFYSNTLNTGNTSTVVFSDIMLNEGETALPYEPYGWLHSLRKLTTATEAVENPLYSDGTAITAYTLKGNEEHTGTPSPQNPVMPNGVGEMSDNLCNPTPYKAGYYINAEGQEVQNNVFDVYSISATENQSYTISANVTLGGNTVRIHAYTNGTWTEQVKAESSGDLPWSFTAPTGCDEIRISITHNAYEHIMVNTGTTALPFEPYGQYKIPISNGQQTTNVYLGETQSTRQIRKVVLTGDEFWNVVQATNTYRYETGSLRDGMPLSMQICSHFKFIGNTQDEGANGTFAGSTLSTAFRSFFFSTITSTTEWKQWLADQYAAGTPVTVWYVLATAETAIVNEPLMKIGDYADTLSNAAQIPTTEGANSITVDTTVQPSEFTATWSGWHNASVKEKSENLFDGEIASGYYNDSGVLIDDSTTSHSTTYIPVDGTTYTISGLWTAATNFAVYEWDTNKNWLRRSNRQVPASSTLSFTIGSDTAFITLQIKTEHGNIMLNTGSTALPYEPYWK